MDEVTAALKAIIDREGLNYLDNSTFAVYTELLKSGKTDAKTARLILIALLAGVHKQKMTDVSAVSSYIQQECCLEKSAADEIACIYAELFSKANSKEWKDNKEKGFREFCEKMWHFELESTGTWHGGSTHLDLYCSLNIDVEVSDADKLHNVLQKKLSKNPFTTAETIHDFLEKKLQEQLNDDFEEYCTVEEYYPAQAEEYYIDSGSYWLSDFCSQHGLNLISCEYDGDTSDFIPGY